MDRLSISQDVLLKIRGLCRESGKTADQVLRRLLEDAAPWIAHETPGETPQPENPGDGFTDATYGLHFPERSEIFRTYKGRSFSARVVRGRWLLDANGRSYDSLNQLSQGVIDGNENAWKFWFSRDPGGSPKRIADLRDPALVQKRPRRKASPTPPALAAGNHPRPPAPPPATAVRAPDRGQSPRPVATASPSGNPSQTGGMPWEPHKF